MGLFRASRKEKEEQAERERERLNAEREREKRLQIELAASELTSQEQSRFQAEWGAWLRNLNRVQKQTDEALLTSEILAAIGDIPRPNASGFTRMGLAGYRGFVGSYTRTPLSALTSSAPVARGNRQSFWDSVQVYVDANLRFA